MPFKEKNPRVARVTFGGQVRVSPEDVIEKVGWRGGGYQQFLLLVTCITIASEAAEVALLILKGLSHKEIATLRSTSEATVRQQSQSIYHKADLPGKTDTQLSALANWTNDARSFGVMVQAFSEERHLRRDGQELLGYERILPGSPIALSNPNLSGVYYPTLIGWALF